MEPGAPLPTPIPTAPPAAVDDLSAGSVGPHRSGIPFDLILDGQGDEDLDEDDDQAGV